MSKSRGEHVDKLDRKKKVYKKAKKKDRKRSDVKHVLRNIDVGDNGFDELFEDEFLKKNSSLKAS